MWKQIEVIFLVHHQLLRNANIAFTGIFYYWLFIFWRTWGAELFLKNRSLRWDSGILHTNIIGCESIRTAFCSLGVSCLLLSYVVMNFRLAWRIFEDNRRNSNLMLISVSSVMAFPWGLCTLYYRVLILRASGEMSFIFLMSGSGRKRNVISC